MLSFRSRAWGAFGLALVGLTPAVWAQNPLPTQPGGRVPAQPPAQQILSRDRLSQPVYRVAEAAATPALANRGPNLTDLQPNEHPLMPAIRWAKVAVDDARKIQDYSCTFFKRERIEGELKEHESMFMKVRHEPFSIYLYFLSPSDKRGQEVIYIKGENEGKMWAHTTGLQHKVVGAVLLNPTGMIAMQGNRYPITDAGVLNLMERLIQIGEADTKYGECEVKFFQGAKVSGRVCTCIQVMHPVPRRNFLFHLARIYVDDEMNLPIRYEAYSWPTAQDGPPLLTEEYTYLNLKLNNGFTDQDFSKENSQYRFGR